MAYATILAGFASFFYADSCPRFVFFRLFKVRFVTVFQEKLSGTEYLGRPDNWKISGPGPGSGSGPGPDNVRQRSALRQQMVLALTLTLVLALTLALAHVPERLMNYLEPERLMSYPEYYCRELGYVSSNIRFWWMSRTVSCVFFSPSFLTDF